MVDQLTLKILDKLPVGAWFTALSNRLFPKTKYADVQILKALWRYLNYDEVNGFLDGFAMGQVHYQLVADFDNYVELRQNPKYRLYDKELEKNLEKFDVSLQVAKSRGSVIFGPPLNGWNGFFIPDYAVNTPGSELYYKRLSVYKAFIQEEVHAVWISYDNFVTLLKKRHIFHEVAWDTAEVSSKETT